MTSIYALQSNLDDQDPESQVLKNVRDGYLKLGFSFVFAGGVIYGDDIRDVNAVLVWPVRRRRFGEYLGKVYGLVPTGGPKNARIAMEYWTQDAKYQERKRSRSWSRRRRISKTHIAAQGRLN